MEKFNWLVEWLWEIIKMQFFCYLYMLRGGVIFGVFPAIVAVYALVRHLYIHGSYQSINISMKKYYKENFKAANVLGWMLTIFSMLTYWNWYLIPQLTNDGVKIILYGVVSIFTLLLLITWIYFLPVMVQFKMKTFEYLYRSILIGLNNFSHTVLQVLVLMFIYFFSFQAVQISIFILIPILAIVQMYICLHVFKLIKDKNESVILINDHI